MAQAEDTELRDLVIDALERNGSLAKIRALLRANIFLAFEDGCANMKQNAILDNILKQSEGILALSVIHEFLEFCNLKNTLFVYMSESRQGNEYNYAGTKSLNEKFNILKSDMKEPILLTLVKNILKPHNIKSFDSNISSFKDNDKCDEKNYGDDQNCTYILHEDSQSSTTSNSNSDNSSDEKNKLHLRLQLDNSDTDTSSDFARDKSSSEYVPGDHILQSNNISVNASNVVSQKSIDYVDTRTQNNYINHVRSEKDMSVLNSEFKTTNSNSDSTSYLELKPFNAIDEKMLNTSGLPSVEIDTKSPVNSLQLGINSKNDFPSPESGNLGYISPKSNKENSVENSDKKSQGSIKSDGETGDFSYGDDFSISSVSKTKDIAENQSENHKIELEKSQNKTSSMQSPHQASQTSLSSVSLSEVADLVSQKSSKDNAHNSLPSLINSKDKDNKLSKLYSDDSGDFSESPVPSLSNLSLDIHSD